MKKLFTTLLCFSLAIPVIAGGPRLSRSDIGHVTMIENPVLDASSMTDANSSLSLSQVMRERHVSTNDNRLNNRSPRQQTIEELEGIRIASSDAYNFEWDSSNLIAEIDSTSNAMKGSYCQITYSETTGKMNLKYFYDDFTIPMEIDLLTGSVTIEAGRVLSSIQTIETNESTLGPMLSNNALMVYWRLYAMPLSWLTGEDDNYDDIHGYVTEDGSITFNDDFAFLIKSETIDSVREWDLSPIFKNLILLKPNGNHRFTYIQPDVIDSNCILKPIMYDGVTGYSGLVPGKPKPKPSPSKPVKPRDFENDNNSLNQTSYNGFHPNNGIFKLMDSDKWIPAADSISITSQTDLDAPVYMFWIDDTLMVYNLFGLGNCCYMEVNELDGTMVLPIQEIYNNGLDSVIYNEAKTGTWSQGSITWGSTSIFDDGADYENHTFTSNNLSFTVTPQPSFEVWFDDSEMFIAMALSPYEVHLYMCENESDDYQEVNNPLALPRQNEPYWVHLGAIAYDPRTKVYSEMAWLDFEVPALGEPPYPYLRGDVDDNGTVNISDVTALINHLLSQQWDSVPGEFSYDNADCDESCSVTIADVTALINYLLSGSWAK